VSVDAVTLFFALLAVAAEVGAVALLLLVVGARFSARVARWREAVLDAIGPSAYGLAWVVAAVATAGSLYLSEVANFRPCRLCWYQRFAMYPLVVVLLVVAWRRWVWGRWLVLGIAAVGGSISIWHILIENFPSLEGSTSCDPANPCSLIWVERLGYLTIPTMALSGFALIVALMLHARDPQPD
jgi:disulfide bond formation protein DsbB